MRDPEEIDILLPIAKNIKFTNDQDFDEAIEEGEMSENLLRMICEQMEYVHHEAGECVFHYGDHGDLFYFILEGKVSVLIPTSFTAGGNQNNLVQTATVDDYGNAESNDTPKKQLKTQFRNTVDLQNAAAHLRKELQSKVDNISNN